MSIAALVDRLRAWDRAASQRCRSGGTAHLRRWVMIGAHLGDGWLWIGLVALGLVIHPAWHPWLGRWALALALAAIVTTSLKRLWRCPRPAQRSGFYSLTYDRHSFPSGHAARLGIAAILAPTFFPGWGWGLLPFLIWCGWARVALGIHYVLDVAVGAAIGAAISWLVLAW